VRRSLYKGRFQEPKSRSSKRKIDMGPSLGEVLKRYKAEQSKIRLKAGKEWVDNDLLFCRPEGGPLDADNLYHRDSKRILKRAGLRQIRIHDLRHTFAASLIKAAHHPKYIQNQMGYYSITVTMDLYGHLMPDLHQGAAKRSKDFVFGNEMATEMKKGSERISLTP